MIFLTLNRQNWPSDHVMFFMNINLLTGPFHLWWTWAMEMQVHVAPKKKKRKERILMSRKMLVYYKIHRSWHNNISYFFFILLDFWDTAGQERFSNMHPSYYYQAHACILVSIYACIWQIVGSISDPLVGKLNINFPKISEKKREKTPEKESRLMIGRSFLKYQIWLAKGHHMTKGTGSLGCE